MDSATVTITDAQKQQYQDEGYFILERAVVRCFMLVASTACGHRATEIPLRANSSIIGWRDRTTNKASLPCRIGTSWPRCDGDVDARKCGTSP